MLKIWRSLLYLKDKEIKQVRKLEEIWKQVGETFDAEAWAGSKAHKLGTHTRTQKLQTLRGTPPTSCLLACLFVRLVVCSLARLLACSFARLLVCSFDCLLACSVVCLLAFLCFACFLPGLLAWELEIRSLEAA